jgi:hypothetical protein
MLLVTPMYSVPLRWLANMYTHGCFIVAEPRLDPRFREGDGKWRR